MTLTRYTPLRRTAFRRRNRFGARPVHNLETGQSFDSTGENKRWGILQLLERAGRISGLVLHPKIVLIAKVGDAPEIVFRPDYAYTEDGRVVYEDFKPRPVTDRERLLFKLWRHFGPGPLRITGRGGVLLRQIPGGGGG